MAGRNLFATADAEQQPVTGRNLFADDAPTQPQPAASGRNVLSSAQPTSVAPEYTPDTDVTFLPDVIDRGLIGVGRGFVDVGEGIGQLARKGGELVGLTTPEDTAKFEEEVRQERALFDRNLGNDTSASIGRFVGQVAPTLVAPGAAAGAGILKQATLAGVTGAGLGATSFVDEEKGDSRLSNALVGGATGAGAGAVLGVGGKVLDKSIARFKAKKSLGTDVDSALNDLGVEVSGTGKTKMQQLVDEGMTPAQALRAVDAEEQGVNLTRGQISREFRDQQFESEAAKIAARGDSGKLRQQLEDANKRFGEQFDNLLRETNPQVSDTFAAGELLRSSLELGQEAQDKLVREAYDAARLRSGGEPIQVPQLANVLDEAMDFRELVPGVSGIQRMLQRVGAIEESGVAGRGMSLKQAENIRKRINQMLDGASRQEKFYLTQLKEALDSDVIRGSGGDIFKDARSVASQGFAKFKDVKPVQAILDGRISDEKIIEGILKPASGSGRTWNVGEIRKLKSTVDSVQPKAWDDVKAGTIQWLRDKALSGQTQNEAGDRIFSGANMSKALENIGQQKLDVLFSKKEQQAIKQLARVMTSVTNRVPGSVNTSNTSSAAFNKTLRIIDSIPGAASIFSPLTAALRGIVSGAQDIAQGRGVREALEDPTKSIVKRSLRERRGDIVTSRQKSRSGVGSLNLRPRLAPSLAAVNQEN